MKKNKGITLIALIITIIVMLILVGVTVTSALNGGLFNTAKKATTQMEEHTIYDQIVGSMEIDEKGNLKVKETYERAKAVLEAEGKTVTTKTPATEAEITEATTSIISEVKGKNGTYLYKITGTEITIIDENASENGGLLAYDDASKDGNGILTENATYTDTESQTAVVPAGFKVSEVTGENTISTGLVIKDENGNEFVWIPVTEDIENSYRSGTNYSEPTALTSTSSAVGNNLYDSQGVLDYLYGTNYYSYAENFDYVKDYEEMIISVNKYDGFYIGRYETTIDSTGNLGSKNNETVLTAGTILKEGTNSNNNQSYYYRWYGLYAEQKKMNVAGNGTTVQTQMISGILWDKTMEYISAKTTTYDVNNSTELWHQGGSIAKSGQLNPGDIALNIWDLESNVCEWTSEAISTNNRIVRGRLL